MEIKFEILQSRPEWESLLFIANRLSDWDPHLVGGCVRDLLLGREITDFDLCSKASPEQVMALFPDAIPIGIAFGVVLIKINEFQFEVTSFRKDGLYVDGRRPQNISFASLEEDSARRDFTINAIYLSLPELVLKDPQNGIKDIQHKLIKSIGNANSRLSEDHLRILRAYRFASQLDFQIERDTLVAMDELQIKLKQVSIERKITELRKIFYAQGRLKTLKEMAQKNILNSLFDLPDFFIYPTNFEDVDKIGSIQGFWLYLFKNIIKQNSKNYDTLKEKLKLSLNELQFILIYLKYQKIMMQFPSDQTMRVVELFIMFSKRKSELELFLVEFDRWAKIYDDANLKFEFQVCLNFNPPISQKEFFVSNSKIQDIKKHWKYYLYNTIKNELNSSQLNSNKTN